MLFFRAWIVWAIIVLSRWEVERRRKSEDRRFASFSDLPVLVLEQCFPAKLMALLLVETLDNDWWGLYRPLSNLMQTFRACHLWTFNVAAILFWGHPYIWRTTIHHDTCSLEIVNPLLSVLRPSCLQTTVASLLFQWPEHTVNHCPWMHTSTWPSKLFLPPTNRTSVLLQIPTADIYTQWQNSVTGLKFS